MRISELIAELEHLKQDVGDVEVTCTGCLAEETVDPSRQMDGSPFESTVETVMLKDDLRLGKRVRLYWQK